jgi:uncharacterized membrane protein (DUF106 family)
MSAVKAPESIKEFPLALIKNMTTLATSGFGVVVALAWNEAIKAIVEQYIDPYLGKNSGVVSLFIYATIMTFLAVVVTMQLSAIQKTLEELQDRFLIVKKNQENAAIAEAEAAHKKTKAAKKKKK